MTVGSLTRVLLHRWYLTLVVLAVVAWLARGAWIGARPEYQSSATFLVTPSVALSTPLAETVPGTQPGSRNPFSLSGGAGTLASTVATALGTTTVQAGFLATFPDARFAAGEATSSTGSRTYFEVSATTATPEAGAAVIAAALQAGREQLLDVQRAVQAPDNGLFVLIQATPTDGPLQAYPERARAVGAIGLGGLAAGVVLVVGLDAALSLAGRGRRSRRERRAGTAPTPATTGEHPGSAPARDVEPPRTGPRSRAVTSAPARERADSPAPRG